MTFTPYLSFQGECAEAFNTYARLFGGEAQLSRFDELPEATGMPPLEPDQTGWVMHAQLTLPDGSRLLGCDNPPQFGGERMAGSSIAVTLSSEDEIQRIFDGLAEDGHVKMEPGPTFFAKFFAMLTDRFGASWMLVVESDGAGEGK